MNYNILYVASTLKNIGPNKQQFYIFKYLDRNVFKPHILTLYEEHSTSLIDNFKAINVPVTSLCLNKNNRFKNKIHEINKYIESNNINLIHSFGYRANTITQNLKVPSVISIRNYPFNDYPKLYGKLLGNLLALKHIQLIKKSKNIILCSSYLVNKFKDKLKNDYNVIQNGVDTEIFHKKEKNNLSGIRFKEVA